jgi:hypothetical protein
MSEPTPEPNLDDPFVKRQADLLLYVYLNPDGTINVALGNVEPSHLGQLFSPNFAATVEHAMFSTAAAAHGPVEGAGDG